jgi:hypothetical protein
VQPGTHAGAGAGTEAGAGDETGDGTGIGAGEGHDLHAGQGAEAGQEFTPDCFLIARAVNTVNTMNNETDTINIIIAAICFFVKLTIFNKDLKKKILSSSLLRTLSSL